MEDSIVAYKAQGLQNVAISKILNCTESYVSQVVAANADKIAETAKKLALSKTEEKIEEDYVKLEERTIAQIGENLPFAEFGELTRLMDTLIKRKQSRAPFGLVNNTNVQNNITVLQVPKSVLPGEIVVNPQGELIAVGEKSLAPMPSSSVKTLFERIKKHRLTAFPEVDISTLRDMPEDF